MTKRASVALLQSATSCFSRTVDVDIFVWATFTFPRRATNGRHFIDIFEPREAIEQGHRGEMERVTTADLIRARRGRRAVRRLPRHVWTVEPHQEVVHRVVE